MNAKARTARRITRDRATTHRATRKAVHAVATGTPQTARTHLIAAGIDTATAKRYAGAFSNRAQPTATTTAPIKLKGRATKTVTVKLYDRAAFAARLAAYRPRDPQAAAQFTQAAHRLAA
jgi:hypothetical protein